MNSKQLTASSSRCVKILGKRNLRMETRISEKTGNKNDMIAFDLNAKRTMTPMI